MASEPGHVLSGSELAERTHLETPTVAKLLKPLAQAGLVEGFRGASGGYRLAQDASRLSLQAIVEAMEGPLGMTECSAHAGMCHLEAHFGERANWRTVNAVLAATLDHVPPTQLPAPPPQPTPHP